MDAILGRTRVAVPGKPSVLHGRCGAGATACAAGRRQRHVRVKSPMADVQDLRVERAVHLLKTSDRSLEQIAALVGYADGVTLRKLLRRRTGRSARDIRASA